MSRIDTVEAWEVLDSRGQPTVRVRVSAGSASGTFTVPAGASTGQFEAVERRDGDERFGGAGVRIALQSIREVLAPSVRGMDVRAQGVVDGALVDTDGTDDLHRLGANAVLGVSGAVAHAAADASDLPLYEYLAPDAPGSFPMPMINVISGGLHAAGGISIQDFLVVPIGADSFLDAIEMAWSVRDGVRQELRSRGHRPLVADEGGYAPPLSSPEAAFDYLEAGVRAAGLVPGEEVAYAVDFAASQFFDGTRYDLQTQDEPLDAAGMIDLVARWCTEYPIVSVEDPLSETDWTSWRTLTDRLPDYCQVLGDDLIATNPRRLQRAIDDRAATAVLVKPNQAGTISRTLAVLEAGRSAGVGTVVSARSGETCDSTIADLAVAYDAGQIKIGSLARSERLAKYNRLLEIHRSYDAELAHPISARGWD